ncbi:helix-turn-helix domain-containing protein [Aquiflexum sp. LQ15W]|uniref:helix-turn-helix domain-containing protein n=1 Tax=Cognataquiflexum nitidum TaxID=2922272 RepID=UPI001F12ED85|nr:helix-turn-helix domain-containing protein [Cognataquiflexum nitidum]MCH6199986.1 helix-turn-helix domain-containing protein [Cognataquiflexum nitidum]
MESKSKSRLTNRELVIKSIEIMHLNVGNKEETDLDHMISFLGMPQRTFYYTFKKVTGESPKRFIKHLKMRKIHQDLKTKIPGQNIKKIASEYGFSHMGQFSQDYKNVIGELASSTLKR